MKRLSSVYCVSFIVGLASICQPVKAQNTNPLVFGPVYVRLAPGNTSGQPNKNSPPANFSSSTLDLTCPSSTITAVLTSSPSGSIGKVLVDNYINLTVTPGGIGTASGSPVDICGGGTSDSGTDHSQECYASGFSSAVGSLVGDDLDSLVSVYGVAPLDISSYLVAGPQQATFDLVDLGDYVASSSLYLNTNCTQTGVSGQVNLTGNTISTTTPPANLTQDYSIDSTSSQKFQFVYDLSKAQSAGTLSIPSGTTFIPYVTDVPMDHTTFQSTFVTGTSFATSSCLIHSGELLNGVPACAVYTLECTSGTSTTPSGAQCPVSSQPNELFNDVFDGPSFTMTGHQGVGFLMASEGWPGGPCRFDAASGLQNVPCPQNLLTNFSGPGLFALSSATSHPNSTFLAIYGVPEDVTTVTVANQKPGYWVNTHTPSVTLSSQPPTLKATGFIPSPILSITYGITPFGSIQPTPLNPASGDMAVATGVSCPLQTNPSDPPAGPFTTPQETLTVPEDGDYLVHYYAQDCAGTKEYQFTNTAGSWSTSYYTYPINVDTVKPAVNAGPTLSPAADTLILGDYIQGQSVTASYSCTDDRSGVVTCGSYTFSSPSTTQTPSLITSPVNTSTTGAQVYTVQAVDAAGNQSSNSVSYTVIVYDTGIQITQKGTRVDVSISPISGHPATGSVELYLGINPYQSAKLTGGGVAHFNVSGLTGSNSVSAVYAGNLSAPVTLIF